VITSKNPTRLEELFRSDLSELEFYILVSRAYSLWNARIPGGGCYGLTRNHLVDVQDSQHLLPSCYDNRSL